jgi:glutaconate CoA-transferase subunit B
MSPTAGGAPVVSREDQMTVVAARALSDGTRCFVGIGLPSVAANLARGTHAPRLVLVYESGTIGAKPLRLPLSIGDGELAETADAVVTVPEIFNYWLQPGRIDTAFLAGAQIDRRGNINTTVVGSYERPTVRLPGAGGAPEIASGCERVIVVMRQNKRSFVDELDFLTSVGHPERVITDIGVLQPEPATGELVLTALHPGARVDEALEATSWPLKVAGRVAVTDPPTADEMRVLQALREAR